MSTHCRPLLILSTAVFLAASFALSRDLAAQDPDNFFFAPHSIVSGRTIGDWLAEYWRRVVETPAAANPSVDETLDCRSGQSSEVFFLPGGISVDPPSGDRPRSCVVPARTPVFVQLISNFGWTGDSGAFCRDCEECQVSVAGAVDQVSVVELQLDAARWLWPKEFSTADLAEYRESPDDCIDVDLPPGAIFDFAPGPRSNAAADGYVVILKPLLPGSYTIRIHTVVGPAEAPVATGTKTWELEVEASFLRGDCNDDGLVDISDPVFSLGSLFLGQGVPSCDDACDSNDDGAVDISDATTTLGVLFLGNGIIPLPGMTECGVDPTDDEVDCGEYKACP